MAYLGQPVIFRDTSTEFHAGVVGGNISGGNADIVAFTNGNQWSGGQDHNSFIIPQWGAAMGSGVGEWLPLQMAALNDTFTPASNSRTLGTTFQPSSTRPTLVIFSVRVVSQITISGGQAGRIELQSDASNPPSTVRGRVAGGITGTAVVGLTLNDTAEGTMVYLVPAGHFARLQSTNETGTPTYSITAQWEIVL